MNNTKKKTTTKTSGAAVKSGANQSTSEQNKVQLAFGTTNYILLGIGIVLLGLGYILLIGGGSDDPNVFNDAMFDNRRLVWSPLFIVIGLVVEICAIMFRPKKENKEE